MQITPLLPAFWQAVRAAQGTRGQTAPNPPVGAVGLNARGDILSIQIHPRAGEAHAEARVIADCRERGILHELYALFITLEPCNHTGRTPPCTEAILHTSIKEVWYGTPDPNPRVAGRGAERLRAAGIATEWVPDAEIREACRELIQSFRRWSQHQLPWVTVKTAHRFSHEQTLHGIEVETPTWAASMIPPLGQKTFTAADALRFAHELRKRADAIITGSGTVLADHPLFTVRHVADFPQKKRWLVAFDRRGRINEEWWLAAEARGFMQHRPQPTDSLETVLRWLAQEGAHEVLVEAGPTLSRAILASPFWCEHVQIYASPGAESNETQSPSPIVRRLNPLCLEVT